MMRQLNNIHFDTKEGASGCLAEIVSSQFAPSVSQKDENQMNYKQAKKEGKRVDYVFEFAKTDKGMTAKDTALFHLCNPNGNYTLCKEWGSEAYDKGYFIHGIIAGSWHRDQLNKLSEMKKPRWWNVRYHVNTLYEDAVEWAEKVKDVENRTDEEKEYVENFLKGGK